MNIDSVIISIPLKASVRTGTLPKSITKSVTVVKGALNTKDTITYTYDKQNKLTSSKQSYGDYKVNYLYDAFGRVSSADGLLYSYDSNNRLVSTMGTYKNSAIIYSPSGQVLSFFSNYPSGGEDFDFYTFDYPNSFTRNPSSMIVQWAKGGKIIYEFNFDDKQTPYQSSEFLAFNGWISAPFIPTDNNVVQQVTKNELDQVNGTLNFIYDYNSQGYPTKVTGVLISSSASVLNISITYFYD